ncbi:hypothetical protein EJB05_38648, partial [Eragrostis curvula]
MASAQDAAGTDLSEVRQRGKPSNKEIAARHDESAGCEVTDSIERVFESEPVPSWREQVTLRALVVSAFLAVVFSLIVMKLSLTAGIIPSLNVSAGLLGYFFLRLWTAPFKKLKQPFTRQENTVIQTCVVAAYGIAFSGGFGSYLFGMSATVASQAAEENNKDNIKEPRLAWMIGFLFLVSFVGLFALVPLRKVMIIDYKLTYPSGTATAHLINGFHTPDGSERAKFYFDWSPTYIGAGMICPHIVNVSVLLGGILSWGVMWPLIAEKRGSWFGAELSDKSLEGMQGYRVFIAIAIILGDGFYNFAKVLIRTVTAINASAKKKKFSGELPVNGGDITISGAGADPSTPQSFDDARRTEFFLKDQIPKTVAIGGYVAVAAVSVDSLENSGISKTDPFSAAISCSSSAIGGTL